MTTPWIVCAWYTPDYRHWTDKLIASLDAVGAPHDIVEVPKLPGSWDTMAKPSHLLDAMDRHPDKVIVLPDVDCLVRGDLSSLAGITGDVGFYIRTKWRRSGGMRFGARSGAVVVRPTAGARAYVHAWEDAAREAPWGDVDQTGRRCWPWGACPGAASRSCPSSIGGASLNRHVAEFLDAWSGLRLIWDTRQVYPIGSTVRLAGHGQRHGPRLTLGSSPNLPQDFRKPSGPAVATRAPIVAFLL